MKQEEKVESVTITLYPSQRAKIERLMRVLNIRKGFSQAIQRLIDEAPEPQLSDAEAHGQAVVARP